MERTQTPLNTHNGEYATAGTLPWNTQGGSHHGGLASPGETPVGRRWRSCLTVGNHARWQMPLERTPVKEEKSQEDGHLRLSDPEAITALPAPGKCRWSPCIKRYRPIPLHVGQLPPVLSVRTVMLKRGPPKSRVVYHVTLGVRQRSVQPALTHCFLLDPVLFAEHSRPAPRQRLSHIPSIIHAELSSSREAPQSQGPTTRPRAQKAGSCGHPRLLNLSHMLGTDM